MKLNGSIVPRCKSNLGKSSEVQTLLILRRFHTILANQSVPVSVYEQGQISPFIQAFSVKIEREDKQNSEYLDIFQCFKCEVIV